MDTHRGSRVHHRPIIAGGMPAYAHVSAYIVDAMHAGLATCMSTRSSEVCRRATAPGGYVGRTKLRGRHRCAYAHRRLAGAQASRAEASACMLGFIKSTFVHTGQCTRYINRDHTLHANDFVDRALFFTYYQRALFLLARPRYHGSSRSRASMYSMMMIYESCVYEYAMGLSSVNNE